MLVYRVPTYFKANMKYESEDANVLYYLRLVIITKADYYVLLLSKESLIKIPMTNAY